MKLKLMFLALGLFSQAAFADVQWIPGHGNAGHTGYYAMQTNPANYHLLWKKDVDVDTPDHHMQLMSGFVVVDNKLIYEVSDLTADNKTAAAVVALDIQNGGLLWSTNHDCLVMDISYSAGMIVYNAQYCSYRLGAYDSATGRLLYSNVIPYPIGDLNPYGDTVYYDDSNKNTYVAYNPINSKVIWENNEDNSPRGTANIGVNNEYVVSQTIGSNKITVMSRLKGKTLFEMNFSGHTDFWSPPTMNDTGKVVYFKMREDNLSSSERPWSTLHAVDLSQRTELWQVKSQDIYSFPVVTKDYVFGINQLYNQIEAIDIVTGKIAWTWSPPADDSVLETFYSQMVATSDVIFASGSKRIYAISFATHRTAWQFDLSAERKKLSLADGKLIVSAMEKNSLGHDTRMVYVFALK